MTSAARFALDVLGAGPAYTDRPGATGAAYLLRTGETSIVLDLGQGSFTRLAGLVEPSTLDAVFVSHLHPDHFIDLVALRHYLRWEFDPHRHVRVVGPAGLGDRLDALHADPGFSGAALDVETLTAGRFRAGAFVVDVAHVTHTEDSYGFRVGLSDGPPGPGLVYSGDCARAEDLDVLVQPGDAILSEVSYGPGPAPTGAPHIDGPSVGELARRTEASRVLLTHLGMGYDVGRTIESVRSRFDGPVELVAPGDAFTIGT